MRPARRVTFILGVLFCLAPYTVLAQAPAAPGSPNPSDGQTGVSATTTLQWGQVSGATSYDVNFGTSNPPSSAQTNMTALSYQPNVALIGGQTYYWQVIVHNASGHTVGPIWSFTVANTSGSTLPNSGATANSTLQNLGFGVALSLQWNIEKPDIITDAQVDANGIVRVNTRANTSPGFMLEMHYLPWKTKSQRTGFGPFVAVQPGGTGQIISAVGAGGMVDWKISSDATGRKGFGLGIGYASIPQAKTLGDEFVPNQPAPTGPGGTPLPVRFETRDKGSLLLVLSFTF